MEISLPRRYIFWGFFFSEEPSPSGSEEGLDLDFSASKVWMEDFTSNFFTAWARKSELFILEGRGRSGEGGGRRRLARCGFGAD